VESIIGAKNTYLTWEDHYMVINMSPDPTSEEVVIDLSNIPLKPMGKKEIQQLEMGLIIATLYSPEVLELIKDPVERATWVDSLAVAAAALAREKAGYTISQIAEEVGRSETTIRAHLTGKTKAGKLVRETYEKLKSGNLKIVVPFVKAREEMVVSREELEKQVEELKKKYEERINELEKRINELEKENNELKKNVEEKEKILNELKEKLAPLKEVLQLLGI
jgi:probable regulatory domain-containing protein